MDRVTTLGSTNAATGWIASAGSTAAKQREQVATGVRFEVASEAPADAANYLRNQRSLDRMVQLSRNHANARLWMETGDTALRDTVTSLTRGRTLAVQGANSITTPEARAAIAGDLRAVAGELRSLSNTTISGRPIFAGTASTPLAYDDAGNYLGDNGQVVRNVTTTDSFVVAGTGPQVFGTPDGGDPFNGTVFQILNATADAVDAGDVAATRQGIEAIDAAIGRTQGELGRLGNLSSQLEEISSRNEASQISTQAQISDVRDVDLGEAIVRLRAAESSYEASLSAAARSLSRSLLDFLR
ncbi:MAG: flagellin [Acidimicrobiales bacterium]